MDGKTHLAVGTLTGSVGASIYCHRNRVEVGWAELIVVLLGSLIGGVLPDILEPATSPWHRGLMHSVPAGGGIVWSLDCLMDDGKCPQWAKESPLLRLFLISLLFGCSSHLALDMFTKNGLPLLSGGRGLSLHELVKP